MVNYLKEDGTFLTEVHNEMQRVIDEFNDGLHEWDGRYVALMLALQDQIKALNEAAFAPRQGATTVYVDPVNGLDTNAGTMLAPFKTVTKAIDAAEWGAQTADTMWTIQLAPGTYTERVTMSKFTPFNLNVTIQGPIVPHPAVPMVLFTEGINTVAAAMKNENPNLVLTVNSVKFLGYNGSSSSAGINNAQGRLFCVNVHAEQCFYGVSSVHGELDVKGGLFNNNGRLPDGSGSGAGIRSLMGNRHSIGTQGKGDLTAGPVFTNNRYGFFAQETSTGHTDWCTYTDNETGVVLRVNARANIDGSSFARNLTDIAADGSGHAYISDAVTFGAGVNKSNETTRFTAGSNTTTGKAVAGQDTAATRSERVLAGVYTQQAVTGTTDTVVVDSYTLSAPWWGDIQRSSGTPVKRVKIRAAGTITGPGGTKQITLKFGTKTASVTFVASEEGTFLYEGVIVFAAPDRQIITAEARRHLATSPRNTVSVTNQDMTADQLMLLQVTLGSASDTVSFEYVELIHG
jgi:hypothetical protein